MKLFKKNPPDWTKKEIINALDEFIEIYDQRPIKNNLGGMQFPSMFAFYFILKKNNPEFVIESGVYKGQSTWLIETALPKTKILSIDINLNNREYISKKAKYSDIDFKYHDFSLYPKNSLVLFDDHQNALERLIQCKWFGIKNIVFDDNYPAHQGNCYSIKKALAGSGSKKTLEYKYILLLTLLILKSMIIKKLNKNHYPIPYLYHASQNDVIPNNIDFKFINKNIKTYFEFPPLFKSPLTIFGDAWNDNNYPTDKSILDNEQKSKYQIAFDEANTYVWMTYVQLN